MSLELPSQKFDEFRQTEDQTNVPKGYVRMQFHRKDGWVDPEPVIMPSLRISEECQKDLQELRLAPLRGLVRQDVIIFD